MERTECEICKDIEDRYYYQHDHDEIYSPLFLRMNPLGVGPGEKPYHARFLKCPLCGTYHNYENRQQGIGNTGEYDQIDRFTETENRILKPILETADGRGLLQRVLVGVEFENGALEEKVRLAFEAMANVLPFSDVFVVIKYLISGAAPAGRRWGCTCLRRAVRNNTAVPSPEVHQAVFECFGIRINHQNNRWEDPSDMTIR